MSDLKQDNMGAASSNEESTGGFAGTGLAAARAPIAGTPAGDFAMQPFVKVITEQIETSIAAKHTLTLDYQGTEVTILGLRPDGIRGRNEEGADVVVPYAWPHLKELFTGLLVE